MINYKFLRLFINKILQEFYKKNIFKFYQNFLSIKYKIKYYKIFYLENIKKKFKFYPYNLY
jgi:hypothetical protein